MNKSDLELFKDLEAACRNHHHNQGPLITNLERDAMGAWLPLRRLIDRSSFVGNPVTKLPARWRELAEDSSYVMGATFFKCAEELERALAEPEIETGV